MGERACNECGSGDLVTITMKVDGEMLSFSACHNCEARWWYRGDERVALSSVLDIVTPK